MNLPSTRSIILLSLFCLSVAAPVITQAQPGSCPVSDLKPDAVQGAPAFKGKSYWFGSSKLAALVPADARWKGMGEHRNFRDKFWWWSENFDFENEAYPPLEVTASRLDDPGIQARVSKAANSRADNWHAMLVMIEFPASGCWRITGQYKGESVHLVIAVEDPPPPPVKTGKPWHER